MKDARTHAFLLTLVLVLMASVPAAAADRDGDGLSNFFERRWRVTSPYKADTDGDGIVDSAEDNDHDSLSNLGEQRFRTNPRRRDTDRDGKPDGREDANHNGILNFREQDRRRVPAGLRPALAQAVNDYYPQDWECSSVNGESRVRPCVLGDADGDQTVAIFGDSHALQWTPGFDLAGKRNGWRIVTLLKGACPSVSTATHIQYNYDGDVTCSQWRSNALAWLKANKPDLVVVTNNDGYMLIPRSNAKVRWRNGLIATLAAIPNATKILVLGDTPNNRYEPPDCLMKRPRNLAACATRRVPARKRRFRSSEIAAARATGAKYRDTYGVVCTYDPCPLVQGKVLMWKDGGHLTATIAKQLAPSLARMIRVALR